MCGIAGLIHKGKSSAVGLEMTAMLQALKHRGPDSTGYAVYGEPKEGDYVMRLKVAEAEDMGRGRGIHRVIQERIEAVEERGAEEVAPLGHVRPAVADQTRALDLDQRTQPDQPIEHAEARPSEHGRRPEVGEQARILELLRNPARTVRLRKHTHKGVDKPVSKPAERAERFPLRRRRGPLFHGAKRRR